MPVRLTRTLHVCRLMWRRYSKTSMTSKKMYTDMLDDHTLIRMRKRVAASGQSKFITPEITKAIRQRSSVKRKFRKTRKTNDWEAYRVLRNRMRWKSVIKHFDHLCHSRAGNFRTLWQSLRPLLHRKCAQNGFTILRKIAELFEMKLKLRRFLIIILQISPIGWQLIHTSSIPTSVTCLSLTYE